MAAEGCITERSFYFPAGHQLQRPLLTSISTPTESDRLRDHRDGVGKAVERIRKTLLTLPPDPGSLHRMDNNAGTIVHWRGDKPAANIRGKNLELDVVGQHLGVREFAKDSRNFLDDLGNYEKTGKLAITRIRMSVEKLPARMRSMALVALFEQAVDRSLANSTKNRGNELEIMDEFLRVAQMQPQVVNPSGGIPITAHTLTCVSEKDWSGHRFNLKMGRHGIGSSKSLIETIKVIRILTALSEELQQVDLIDKLADSYFDLFDQRERLMENLSPLVVDMLVNNGRCNWCPAGK